MTYELFAKSSDGYEDFFFIKTEVIGRKNILHLKFEKSVL